MKTLIFPVVASVAVLAAGAAHADPLPKNTQLASGLCIVGYGTTGKGIPTYIYNNQKSDPQSLVDSQVPVDGRKLPVGFQAPGGAKITGYGGFDFSCTPTDNTTPPPRTYFLSTAPIATMNALISTPLPIGTKVPSGGTIIGVGSSSGGPTYLLNNGQTPLQSTVNASTPWPAGKMTPLGAAITGYSGANYTLSGAPQAQLNHQVWLANGGHW